MRKILIKLSALILCLAMILPCVPVLGGAESALDTGAENGLDIGDLTISTTAASKYNGWFCMKVGVDYCLNNGVREPIFSTSSSVYGAPFRDVTTGEIYVPMKRVAQYAGYNISYRTVGGEQYVDLSNGSVTVTVKKGGTGASIGTNSLTLTAPIGYVSLDGGGGFYVMAMNDVEKLFGGWYITYDDMGLIILASRDNVVSRANGYTEMMNVMMEFIYDYADGDTIVSMAQSNTNNFTHPYLFATQDKFDELKQHYDKQEGEPGYHPVLTPVVNELVSDGYRDMRARARIENGEYLGLIEVPVNPNDTEDGYDAEGGRLKINYYTSYLSGIAFAYKMTGDERLAKFCYDWIVALGEWEHWGPGHFLNCADATAPVAMVYDWLYNDYIALGMNPEVIGDILYEKGVYMGYLAAIEEWCPYPSAKQGGATNTGFVYHKKVNNWNAVCSSGMITGALAILGVSEYQDNAAYLISDNIEHLARYGLTEYAPDGSYVESATYWAYGTNNLFQMIAALVTVTGSDFGYMDTWGLDQTCYFACHIESSEFKAWAYHDGSESSLGSHYFPFVSRMTGDTALMAIRVNHLESGKSASIMDAFFYYDVEDDVELPLQYNMVGIDAYTMRSSWNKGAVFAGIMGGGNNVSHGQIDAGNFVYYNKGINWFCELGGDDYNIKNYFSRYNLYRRSAEGNNVLCMTSAGNISNFFGQYRYSESKITASGDNEYGAFSVIDTTAAYPSSVTSAKRGMLLTNSRNTVIVQDEVTMSSPQSFYWFGHYNIARILEIKISADGRTATMVGRDDRTMTNYTLRVRIVSPDETLKFKIMTTYDLVLDNTLTSEEVIGLGGQPEESRQSFSKLAIEISNKTSVNLAVVMEDITDFKAVGKELDTGYEYTPLAEWEPCEDERDRSLEIEKEEVEEGKRPTPSLTGLFMAAQTISDIKGSGTSHTDSLDLYYKALCDFLYNYTANNGMTPTAMISDALAETMGYGDYRAAVNAALAGARGLLNMY